MDKNKCDSLVRFKPYVSIRTTSNYFWLSSGIGQSEIVIINNEDNAYLVNSLKSINGISSEICQKYDIYKTFSDNNLIETSFHHLDHNRNELFFDYAKLDASIISSSRILIFGAGGGGGAVTFLLAQQGFEDIISVDYDVVEDSDIYKSFVYRKDDIGKSKTTALAEVIYNNFGIQIIPVHSIITSEDSMNRLINRFNPSLVIYAIDPSPKYKLYINDICVKYKIPLIYMAYSFEYIIAGPFIVPNVTSCYHSYSQYLLDTTGGEYDIRSINKLYAEHTTHPSMMYIINMLSSIILKDILFFLSNKMEYVTTLNKLLVYNTLNLDGQIYELSCERCGKCCHFDKKCNA